MRSNTRYYAMNNYKVFAVNRKTRLENN